MSFLISGNAFCKSNTYLKKTNVLLRKKIRMNNIRLHMNLHYEIKKRLNHKIQTGDINKDVLTKKIYSNRNLFENINLDNENLKNGI